VTLAKILVPTDFSETAKKALRQACLLAGRGVRIHLVHRLAPPIPPVAEAPGGVGISVLGNLLDEYVERMRQQVEKGLTEEVETFRREHSGVELTSGVLDVGSTSEAILTAAREWGADLIAMGTHGRSGIDKLITGSVASKVLHHSETNVLVVRADSSLVGGEAEPGSVLVPVDFSDHSQRALGFARQFVEQYGGELRLIHVVELSRTPLRPGGLSSPFEDRPELREKYRQALVDMLGDDRGEVTVAEGSPAGGILWWREKLGCRLVVMGSRGLTGLSHWLLGSVAEKVARFCEVPVVVVK
jgi:nucleotide-binding universal stress UspA family protein